MKLIKVIIVIALVTTLGGLVLVTACGKETTPPDLPSSLTKTTPDNNNIPAFSWGAATDEGSGIAAYLVRMDDGDWINLGDVTTYTCGDAISDGSHTFDVKAVDKAGNKCAPVSLTFTVDSISPAISSVSAAGIADRSVTIVWTTDESSTSQVEYGLSASYNKSNPLDSSLVTSHNMTLTALEPNTTYHYRVMSKDASGNIGASADYYFVTLPDTTPPSTPSGLTLTSGYREIKVDWSANSEGDLLGYYLYRSNLVDSGYVQLNSEPTASTSYMDTGLSSNTTYYYRITSIDLYDNESTKSEYVFAKTLTATEAFPAYLAYGGIWITGSGSYEYFECHIANSSIRSVTIHAVEVFDQADGLARSNYGLQDALVPGEKYSYGFFYSLGWMPNLAGWTVKWYGVDAGGAEFTVVGAYIEA